MPSISSFRVHILRYHISASIFARFGFSDVTKSELPRREERDYPFCTHTQSCERIDELTATALHA